MWLKVTKKEGEKCMFCPLCILKRLCWSVVYIWGYEVWKSSALTGNATINLPLCIVVSFHKEKGEIFQQQENFIKKQISFDGWIIMFFYKTSMSSSNILQTSKIISLKISTRWKCSVFYYERHRVSFSLKHWKILLLKQNHKTS